MSTLYLSYHELQVGAIQINKPLLQLKQQVHLIEINK